MKTFEEKSVLQKAKACYDETISEEYNALLLFRSRNRSKQRRFLNANRLLTPA